MPTPNNHRSLVFRGRRVERDRALVMAIINRTPDSFYDRGATFADIAAREAVERVVAEGADIVDIGGVRAGAEGGEVTAEEEIRRVVPIVAWARDRFPELVISVDTWRHEVGREVCEAGADLLNDTWAGTDPRLVEVAAEFGTGYVCSHTGGLPPRTDPYRPHYPDVVAAVIEETTRSAENAVRLGVPREGILIDPTLDFGKNTWHSLELLRHTARLVATGLPVLIALSNKDFIGETLDAPVAQRGPGTLAATAMAARDGAAVFRAHDVRGTRDVLEMVATILGDRRPAKVLRGLA
ncbi:dihydropteroate synthase [Amycolatopsis sp. H20-H5]|uniref:dihydropteroate synthase n=1 Tax=Amycolatopsis sp. H20-H5 TaxID=3046309 RepID=UPI002DB6AA8F|nr:dihydropteroate synthase [Amycolatopsis sp. H20-H5]MEC3977515.1 dihydropteroate synthase [Amycolatopsis sp. H20-H5]